MIANIDLERAGFYVFKWQFTNWRLIYFDFEKANASAVIMDLQVMTVGFSFGCALMLTYFTITLVWLSLQPQVNVNECQTVTCQVKCQE